MIKLQQSADTYTPALPDLLLLKILLKHLQISVAAIAVNNLLLDVIFLILME